MNFVKHCVSNLYMSAPCINCVYDTTDIPGIAQFII